MPDFQLDVELAAAAWTAGEEKARQSNIVAARKYYDGDHDVQLSERQKEYIGYQLDTERFALNYCTGVVDAVYERMLVAGFGGEDKAFSAQAWDWWQRNRMDERQAGVHRGAVCDGEFFVFVDWDEDEGQPVFLPHERYTDPQFDGTGFGCKAFYPDDDYNRPMLYASKRFTEKVVRENGRRETRARMTVYYPDRVEKFVRSTSDESGWAPLEIEGEPWPLPWVDGAGRPLGIPIIHFRNPKLHSELWDAIPPQDLINKTAVDIIASADAAGFPIRLAQGWTATTDGKAPATDKSNYIKVFPGCWIGVPSGASGASTEFVPPADLSPMLATLDSLIVKLAQITDTPTSRFQLTRQVAAEGTLKQQESVLLAKVRARQTSFGNSWEDCMYMARSLANFHSAGLSEDAQIETTWHPAETRDDKAFREAMVLEMQLGVPREKLWAKLGYDADEIAEMKAMAAEEMQATSNVGGELLRAFESGGFGGGMTQQGQRGQEQQGRPSGAA